MNQLVDMHKVPKLARGLTGQRLGLLLVLLTFFFFFFFCSLNGRLIHIGQIYFIWLMIFCFHYRDVFQSITTDITVAILRGIKCITLDSAVAVFGHKYICMLLHPNRADHFGYRETDGDESRLAMSWGGEDETSYCTPNASTPTGDPEAIIGRFEGQTIERLPDGQGIAGNDVTLQTMPEILDPSEDGPTSLEASSEGLQTYLEAANTPADVEICVGPDREDPLQDQPKTNDAPAEHHASVEVDEDELHGIGSETLETPDDQEFHNEAKADGDAECKSTQQPRVVEELGIPSSRLSKAVESRHFRLTKGDFGSIRKETTAQKAASDGVVSASIRKTTAASTVRNRTTARKMSRALHQRSPRISRLIESDGILQAWANEQVVADHIVTVDGDVPESDGQAIIKLIVRNRAKALPLKTRGLVKPQIARRRSHRPEVPSTYKTRMCRPKVTTHPFKVTKNGNGRLRSWVHRNMMAEDLVEFDGRMTGLEFDMAEERMIGSDVEAEMEVDDETPVGGEDEVAAGEPMDLGQDGPEPGSKEIGDSMDID